jgi:hypothetical protein
MAGEVVWQFGFIKKGAGLCHGISGNAYVKGFIIKSKKKRSDNKCKLLLNSSNCFKDALSCFVSSLDFLFSYHYKLVNS